MEKYRAVQRLILTSGKGESATQHIPTIVPRAKKHDSGAAKSPNLCTATQPPGGCPAIVRPSTRPAQRNPRPATGRGHALQAAPCPAVLDPRRGDRRELLSIHQNLHRDPPRPVERSIRAALEACARPYRHSLHPPGPRPAGRRAGFPPARRRSGGQDGRSGATLRRSFDNFRDRKAAQLLHAFDTGAGLILAHIDIEEKSNEIPAAQRLLDELDIAHCVVTLDALHCQKKPSRPPPGRKSRPSSN